MISRTAQFELLSSTQRGRVAVFRDSRAKQFQGFSGGERHTVISLVLVVRPGGATGSRHVAHEPRSKNAGQSTACDFGAQDSVYSGCELILASTKSTASFLRLRGCMELVVEYLW